MVVLERGCSIVVIWYVGVMEWLVSQGIMVDFQVEEFDLDIVWFGDVVIGILLVYFVVEVNQWGGWFLYIVMDVLFE